MPSPTLSAQLVAVTVSHDHPARHHHDSGFLSHLFATSPLLGTIVVIAIVIACFMLILLRAVGRVFEGTPWYVRLALLGTAGYGIFRLLSRQRLAAPPQGPWQSPPQGP
jgi:hypothetical protein